MQPGDECGRFALSKRPDGVLTQLRERQWGL
jgi:hypothetical protein